MFGPRLEDWKGPKRIERVLLERTHVTFARAPLLGLDHFVHDDLPGARHDVWIAGGQIGAGDLQIDGWLTVGLVLGVQQAQGFDAVGGAQTFLLARHIVVEVETTAARATIQSVSLLHNCSFGYEANAAGWESVSRLWAD